MSIQNRIAATVKKGFLTLYNTEIPSVEFQATRKEFEGDITVVVFPMLRYKKGNPVQIGEDLGNYIVDHLDEVIRFNVVKGFLNLVITDHLYLDAFNAIFKNEQYGFVKPSDEKDAVLVEYSSPNTNKPLHLGHVRNNLLGYSVAEIIDTCQNVWGTNLPIKSENIERKNEIPETRCDRSKALKDFGWKPKFSFQEGVKAIKERMQNDLI